MNTERRLTGLSVVGWLWIITGILLVLFMIAVIVIAPVIRSTVAQLSGTIGSPGRGQPAGSVGWYDIWIVGGHMALAAASIVAGVYMLKCRSWARFAIEVLTWISLAYVIGFGYALARMWLAMTEGLLGRDAGTILTLYKIGGGAFCAVLTIALVVPLVIMIRYLRSETVRAVMNRSP